MATDEAALLLQKLMENPVFSEKSLLSGESPVSYKTTAKPGTESRSVPFNPTVSPEIGRLIMATRGLPLGPTIESDEAAKKEVVSEYKSRLREQRSAEDDLKQTLRDGLVSPSKQALKVKEKAMAAASIGEPARKILGEPGDVFGRMKYKFDNAKIGNEIAYINNQMRELGETPDLVRKLSVERAKLRPELVVEESVPAANALLASMDIGPSMAVSMQNALKYGTIGAAMPAALGPAGLPLVLPMFATGAVFGAYKQMKELEGGNARDEMRKKNIPPDIANFWSEVYGHAAAASEMVEMGTVARAFPGGKDLFKRILREEIRDQAGRGFIPAAASGYGATVFGNAAQEAMQQGMEDISQRMAIRWANEARGMDIPEPTIAESWGKIKEAFSTAAQGMAVIGFAGVGAHGAKAANQKLSDVLDSVNQKASSGFGTDPAASELSMLMSSGAPAFDSYAQKVLQLGQVQSSIMRDGITPAEMTPEENLRQMTNETPVKVSADEPMPAMPATPEEYKAKAEEIGIVFNGMQERLNGTSFPLFTDPETKATFAVAEGMTVEEALEAKRAQFAPVDEPNPMVAQNEVEYGKTDTPEFKAWFGDSKVVDEGGKPLLVYHGTNQAFSTSSFEFNDDGAFFNTSPKTASQYATLRGKQGANVIPVYLRIINPLGVSVREWLEGTTDDGADIGTLLASGKYDGVKVFRDPKNTDPLWKRGDTYVAIDSPTQIKSVNNRGTFDPNDPRITMESGKEYRSRDVSKADVPSLFKVAMDSPDGFTVDPSTGEVPKSGWSVSPTKMTETPMKDPPKDEDLAAFLKTFSRVFDRDGRAMLGGWKANDKSSKNYGKYVMDVSYVMNDFADAVYLAELGSQDGIYGFGGEGYLSTPDAVKKLRDSGKYSEARKAELVPIGKAIEDIIGGRDGAVKESKEVRGGREEARVSSDATGATGVQGQVKAGGRQQLPAYPVKDVQGSGVSAPVLSYPEAEKREGNPWVRRSGNGGSHETASNKGRTLMVQFGTNLISGGAIDPGDKSVQYYNEIYSGEKKGYDRLRDFWEIPQWQGFIAALVPDADSYVIRSLDEARLFLREAGYDRLVFSSIDVNKAMIEGLAKEFPDIQMEVGGYTAHKYPGVKNIRWHDTLEGFAKEMGVPYREAVDYRHFSGAKVIPRLTMSQGCKHRCAFCTVEKTLVESSTEFIDQQAEAFGALGARLVYLNDKTFGQAGNYTHLATVYENMKKANPDFEGFIIQTTAGQMLKMPKDWLAKSGIKYVELGLESFNDAVLRPLHKPHNEATLEKAANYLRETGINFIPNVIIGLPGETDATYAKTLDFLKRHSDIISHANIYNLAIYEGAELAETVKVERPEDADENVLAKSFHKDKEVHSRFEERVYSEARADKGKRGESLTPEMVKQREDEYGAMNEGDFQEGEIMKALQEGRTAHPALADAEKELTPSELRKWREISKLAGPSWFTDHNVKAVFGEQKKVERIREVIRLFAFFDVREMTAIARAGQDSGSGWYENCRRFINHLFPRDEVPYEHMMFARILAATSAGMKPGQNLEIAIRAWSDWERSGRTTSPSKLAELFGRGFNAGIKGDVVRGQIINVFSGGYLGKGGNFKQPNYSLNIRGLMELATADMWVARHMAFDIVNPKDPVTGLRDYARGMKQMLDNPGYLAFSARAEQVARKLGLSVAGTQEVMWTFVRSLWDSLDPSAKSEADMFGMFNRVEAAVEGMRDIDIYNQEDYLTAAVSAVQSKKGALYETIKKLNNHFEGRLGKHSLLQVEDARSEGRPGSILKRQSESDQRVLRRLAEHMNYVKAETAKFKAEAKKNDEARNKRFVVKKGKKGDEFTASLFGGVMDTVRAYHGKSGILKGDRLDSKYIYRAEIMWGHYLAGSKAYAEWYADQVGKNSGRVYEFEIPDGAKFMPLDAPIPEADRPALISALEALKKRFPYKEAKRVISGTIIGLKKDMEFRGNILQSNLSTIMRKRDVSEFLRDKAGYDGATYYFEGGINYIIFRDDLLVNKGSYLYTIREADGGDVLPMFKEDQAGLAREAKRSEAEATSKAYREIDKLEIKFMGARVLAAQGMLRDLRLRKASVLIGKDVGTGQEAIDNIAMLMQGYRNPFFETLRFIFVDQQTGKVLSVNGISCGMPGFVMTHMTTVESVKKIADMWEAKLGPGRVKYYMAHNHPGGNPMPSDNGDIPTFERWGDDRLEASLITDHGQYAAISIDETTGKASVSYGEHEWIKKQKDPLLSGQAVPSDRIGRYALSNDAILSVLRGIEVNGIALVGIDSQGIVKCILDVPANVFAQDHDTVQKYMEIQARQFGVRFVAYSPRQNVLPVRIEMKRLVERGVLVEAITASYYGIEGTHAMRDSSLYFGKQAGAWNEFNIREDQAEWESSLESLIKDEGYEGFAEFKQGEIDALLEEARQILGDQRTGKIKTLIRQKTGQKTGTVGNIIKMTELKALGFALKKAAASARIAFREGKAEGKQKEAQRLYALSEMAKAKRKLREEVKRLAAAITKPPGKSIDFEYRQAIEAIQADIDPKFRTQRTLDKRSRSREFFDRNPGRLADLPGKKYRQIYAKPLNDMSIAELKDIAETVIKLKKLGAVKEKARRNSERLHRENLIDKLVQTIQASSKKGEPERRPVVNATIDEMRSRVRGIRASTLQPARLFDKLDGGKSFTGIAHKIFYSEVNKAENDYLNNMDRRQEKAQEALRRIGLKPRDLAKKTKIGGINYRRDEMIDIWLGWMNEKKRLALMYGNNITNAIYDKIDSSLTEKEKQLGLWIIGEYEENYDRLRQAFIRYKNEEMGREEFYTPIRRMEVTGDNIDEEIAQELLEREGLSKIYIDRGFTIDRKRIPAQYQKPIRLGAYEIWLHQIGAQERFIAYAMKVRDLHRIISDDGLRVAINNGFGNEYTKEVELYINRVANPDLYRSHDGVSHVAMVLRHNASIAYLAYNVMTLTNQIPALAFGLIDAGPYRMIASSYKFMANPLKLMREVAEKDPQVRHLRLERDLEELKHSQNNTYEKIVAKVGNTGFLGIYWIDRITRTITWDATYQTQKDLGKSEEEAILYAQESILRTQEGANAKDIPSIYATSEFLNWFLQFTNQLSKIYGLWSHDIPSYVSQKDYKKAFMGMTAFFISSACIWAIANRQMPDEPDDFVEAVLVQAIEGIPLLGKVVTVGKNAWNSRFGIPAISGLEAFSVGLFRDVPKMWKQMMSGRAPKIDVAKSKLVEGLAVTAGLPYTGTKRAINAALSADASKLVGAKRRPK